MKLRHSIILTISAALLAACNFTLAADVTPPPGYVAPAPAPTLGPLYPASAPDIENGKLIYAEKCAPCHGDDGSGGLGKNLRGNKFVKSKSDKEMGAFLAVGRKGTAMDGFKNIMTDEQLGYVIALMRTWSK